MRRADIGSHSNCTRTGRDGGWRETLAMRKELFRPLKSKSTKQRTSYASSAENCRASCASIWEDLDSPKFVDKEPACLLRRGLSEPAAPPGPLWRTHPHQTAHSTKESLGSNTLNGSRQSCLTGRSNIYCHTAQPINLK